jgi:hypothetical protein
MAASGRYARGSVVSALIMIECDRQLADTLARRVIGGVGNGSRNADVTNLANSLRLQRDTMLVTLYAGSSPAA